jgi:hypothetical protein
MPEQVLYTRTASRRSCPHNDRLFLFEVDESSADFIAIEEFETEDDPLALSTTTR